ncbi:hypothetical protein H5410_020046 [Solanum commersonii]|uniref:Uncharacterized protein n=1 Tax=Solanum commersonii TaxID=4109 RepID=A0A9J5Z913_SOLCO|nr:hypothetical protein H5410_020046 [Solanum commersonii]
MGYYDRAKELKAFDDTKAGEKGLVDLEIDHISEIFVIPILKIENEFNAKNFDLSSNIVKRSNSDYICEGYKWRQFSSRRIVEEVGEVDLHLQNN